MGRLRDTAKRLLNFGGSSDTASKQEKRLSGSRSATCLPSFPHREASPRTINEENTPTAVIISSRDLLQYYSHVCRDLSVCLVGASSVNELRCLLESVPPNCVFLFEIDDPSCGYAIPQMIEMVKENVSPALRWVISSTGRNDWHPNERVLVRRTEHDIRGVVLHCLDRLKSQINNPGGDHSDSRHGENMSQGMGSLQPIETPNVGEVDATSPSGSGELPRPSRTISMSQSPSIEKVDMNAQDVEDPTSTPVSEVTPSYLAEIPEEVVVSFGGDGSEKLHAEDPRFRRLLKQACKFPAYFDSLVFRRIQQYRSLTQQLVERGSLAPTSLDSVPGFPNTRKQSTEDSSAISLRDFLRFWTPAVRYSGRMSRFLRAVIPPSCETVLEMETDDSSSTRGKLPSLSRNRVYMEDLQPLVEALVERHPDLRQLRDDAERKSRYVTCVLTSVFASLNGFCQGCVPTRHLRESGVANLFYKCATCKLSQVLPFSLRYFEEAHEVFQRALSNSQASGCSQQTQEVNATIHREGLQSAMSLPITHTVLERIFRSNVKLLNTSEQGRLDFEDYMWFLLAKEDRMRDLSVEYWCRALDIDDDGYLSRQDLEVVYREKLIAAGVSSEQASTLGHNAMCKLMDAIHPVTNQSSREFRISPFEIRKSGAGFVVFDLFVSSSLQPLERQVIIPTRPPSQFLACPVTPAATAE
eukprot:gb/GECG01006680.1/.p1 GENE.gb/GECG01006680.1/~~gb/GECG01006680.1/.p1  ORF type:complete len:697 (+),score=69.51 gb/GECG01006680.1/:1-2091(+)